MEESSGGHSLENLAAKNEGKQEEQNLIVGLRVRPMNEDEIIAGATPVAHKVDERMVVLMDPTDDPDDILRANRSREKQYVFDVSFDGSATQKEVYENTTKFLIPSVVNGFNATVFAYGATGAGKTYTMLGTAEERGIMARTLNDLFMEMEKTRDDMAYKVTVSFLEIYNEMIRDLLSPTSGVLDLREDAKGVQVAGLSKFQANSSREVMDILFKGNKQRTQEPTAANKTSSRSHAVLQITVRQKSRVRDDAHQEVRVGKLFLIDLAGSERAANTQNRGKRMVEGAHINRSLLALGNCINALSDKHAHKYINYRDSKLTRLLKDALGGNCKTVMIATISPASIHFEESRNTLLYADRAKNIKTKVRRNVMDVSYHIAQYSNIIAELRVEIKRLRSKLDNKSDRMSSMQSKFDLLENTDYDNVEKLKNQLVQMFAHQMGLQRSLMELDNKTMELALEDSKNNCVIQKWEREKAVVRRRGSDVDLNKYNEHEKEMDMIGYGSEEPDEVLQARDECLSLHQEEARLMEQRDHISRELDIVKDKVSKVEQRLPNLQSTADQQEIIRLLCKIHELEMENIHMQSSCLLRNMDIKQREMAIDQYKQHHSLADELIQQQRTLMDQNGVAMSKDLEELYELYQQEGNQMVELQFTLPDIHYKNSSVTSLNRKQESESISEVDDATVHLPKIFVPYGGANSVARKNLLKKSSRQINRLEEQKDSLFAKSPRAMIFDDPRITASTVSLSPPPAVTAINKSSRQKSILTLSSRSTATTPSPPAAEDVTPTNTPVGITPVKEERTKIAVNTRNIAALAARRKNTNKLSTQEPTFFLTQSSMAQHQENKLSLTQSRLAQHDERYGSSNSLHHLQNDDDMFSNSNESEPVPAKTPLRKRNIYRQEPAKKKTAAKQRAQPKDAKPNYQQMTPEEFFKKLAKVPPKKHHHQSTSSVQSELPKPRSRMPVPVYPRGFPKAKAQQVHRDSNNGEMTQRTDNTEKATNRTNSRKPLPSIPTYRKGDFGITGQGIH